MKSTLLRFLPVIALFCSSARADVINYTDSGTFSATTTSDALGFSGPDDTWSFSFQADENPNPADLTNVGMGGFSFPFTDFTYTLNGTPVAIEPTFVRFFSFNNGGGFEICFNGDDVADCTDGLATGFGGDEQLYSGPTSAPTLLSGPFDLTAFAALVDADAFNLPDTTLQATVSPEPSTWLLIAAGLFTVIVWKRRPTSTAARQ